MCMVYILGFLAAVILFWGFTKATGGQNGPTKMGRL